MTRRSLLGLGLALALCAAAVIALGRWERDRYSTETSVRMAEVASAVGPSIVDPSISDMFFAGPARCLTYAVGEAVYGISLCFDSTGRLIETTDARGAAASFETLRFEPKLARVSVGPDEVDRAALLLDRITAVRLVAGTAISKITECLDWTKAAATAPRTKVAKNTGAAERHCRDGAATLAALAARSRESQLIDRPLQGALKSAERVIRIAGGRTDVAGRQFFGLLNRRRAVVAAHRDLRRDAVAPLAALHAARERVAAQP